MPLTDDRYARLDAARWLAAAAVVLLHSAALIVSEPSAYGNGAWLAANPVSYTHLTLPTTPYV